MRILFDPGTPTAIADFLLEHTIRTAHQEGWETLSNGALLQAAEQGGFDLLLSTDNSLVHQRSVSRSLSTPAPKAGSTSSFNMTSGMQKEAASGSTWRNCMLPERLTVHSEQIL
jgi:hypothetical protein